MIALGFIQFFFFSLDPIDSNFIIYEQAVNLSCEIGLPKVDQVILKSDVVEVIEHKLAVKIGNRRIEYEDPLK